MWKYTDCFKQEIELGLSAGIEPGQPAADIARSLTQYLQHPDKLFRRVRDQYGNLQLSKAAAAFHPGRGVYRSSYKNARRLAATETNMAYRTADHQRWKAAPYVVGIRISLSHNHTCLDRNGVPQDFTDICDELAGDYPKTFHFTGWHPHCRCTATAILKTQDEIDEDTRRILNGEDPTDPDTSDNHIPNLPKNFTDWQERNADRIASSPNPPAWATAKDSSAPKKNELPQIQAAPQISDAQAKEEINGYKHTLKDVAKMYAKKSGVIKSIYEKLNQATSEIEKGEIIIQLREKCATLSRWELRKWGAVEGLDYVGVAKNYTIQRKESYCDELIQDLLEYKDKSGCSYYYTLGIMKKNIWFKASDASKIIASLSDKMRDNIKGIIFTDKRHPLDAYYKKMYPNFTYGSMYSGDPITVHANYSKQQFKRGICHEIGHHIDTKLGWGVNQTLQDEWRKAQISDGKFYRQYSKVSPLEDFADSVSLYENHKDYFKKNFKNRFDIIDRLFKLL